MILCVRVFLKPVKDRICHTKWTIQDQGFIPFTVSFGGVMQGLKAVEDINCADSS